VLDFRDRDQNASNRFHFHYGGVSMKANAEIGDLTFVSISAVRGLRANWNTDLDLGPLPLLSGHPRARQTQISQEFQLQSNEQSRFKWLAGLYYIHLKEQLDPLLFLYGGSYSSQLGDRLQRSLVSAGRVSSFAGYGQGTVSIDDSTRLTAGLRYTIEARSAEARGQQIYSSEPFIRPIPGLPLLNEEPLKQSKTFRELTWRASLDRDLSDQLMGYLSASRGFQSGGWNLQTPQFEPFSPETVDAFEGGLKFSGPAGRFRADLAAFYYDYSNMQVSAFTAFGSATVNATSANIRGLDLQLGWRPSQAFELNIGGELLRTRFGSFPNASCVNYDQNVPILYAPMACDATGNRLPYAPKLKLNAGATHALALGSAGTILISGSVAYNSGYFSEPDNVVRQEAFTTLDLSAEWLPVKRGPALTFWARNLTNAKYHDSLVTFPTTGVPQRPAAPRRFGISLAQRF
jgi:outer membrane receptor protein involved in Fe transport